MTKIRVGQLVRIKGFSKFDAIYFSKDKNDLIGQTGRFIEWRDERIKAEAPHISFVDKKAYAGDFEYDPDPMGENKFHPTFVAVYVEPLED